jgi:hypothetical protein
MIYRTICVISVWDETWGVLLLHSEDKGTINPLNIIYHSFSDSLWQKWAPGIFPGGKSSRCVGLTTLLTSCADCIEIWEPEPPLTVRDYPGLYTDCPTLLIQRHNIISQMTRILCNLIVRISNVSTITDEDWAVNWQLNGPHWTEIFCIRGCFSVTDDGDFGSFELVGKGNIIMSLLTNI